MRIPLGRRIISRRQLTQLLQLVIQDWAIITRPTQRQLHSPYRMIHTRLRMTHTRRLSHHGELSLSQRNHHMELSLSQLNRLASTSLGIRRSLGSRGSLQRTCLRNGTPTRLLNMDNQWGSLQQWLRTIRIGTSRPHATPGIKTTPKSQVLRGFTEM